MGTISQKLEYLDTTRELIRTNINALGNDITEEDTFRSYADTLDEMWENQEQVTGTGESLTLNTKKGKLKVDLNGNTSQFTTTGKNLLKQSEYISTRTTNAVKFTNNGDGTFNISGTASASFTWNILDVGDITLESGKTYYLYSSQPYNSNTFNLSIPYKQDGTQKYLTANNSVTTSGTITDVKLALYIPSGTNVSVTNVKLMLVEGSTAGDYEPYTGGIASPNPSFPQDVHIVSGDNTINVTGKNLLEPKLPTYTRYGITCTNNGDGSFTLNGTATKDADFRLDQSLPSGTDNLKKYNGTYTLSCNELTNGLQLRLLQNQTWLTLLAMMNDNTPVTATFNKDNCFIYVNVTNGVTVNNLTIRPMLEKSSTATTYEPYTSTSYPIHLGEHWLGWIGDYKDGFFKAINGDNTYDNLDSATKESLTYGEWYLEKKIGKVVLDGSENWNDFFSTTGFYRTIPTMPALNETGTINGISNYYQCTTRNEIRGLSSSANNKCSIYSAELVLVNTSITSVNDFKTWLSTHNTIVYYVLNTPYLSLIEDNNLKEQLEDVWRANSYEGQTNISQVNNDLPFELDVRGLAAESDGE